MRLSNDQGNTLPETDRNSENDGHRSSQIFIDENADYQPTWFLVGDLVDALDSTGHWCEGEVRKIDSQTNSVFISYIYWDEKHDEWVANALNNIAPLNSHTYYEGSILKVGQRVETLDEKMMWLLSYIIDATSKQVSFVLP